MKNVACIFLLRLSAGRDRRSQRLAQEMLEMGWRRLSGSILAAEPGNDF